jgi:hypothetical protein
MEISFAAVFGKFCWPFFGGRILLQFLDHAATVEENTPPPQME